MRHATIQEMNNGFPDVGEFVAGDDGEVYSIVNIKNHIRTGAPGASAEVDAIVKLADWGEIDDANEPTCRAILGEEFDPRAEEEDAADHLFDQMRDDDLLDGRS